MYNTINVKLLSRTNKTTQQTEKQKSKRNGFRFAGYNC